MYLELHHLAQAVPGVKKKLSHSGTPHVQPIGFKQQTCKLKDY